jgi:hypothetical protein
MSVPALLLPPLPPLPPLPLLPLPAGREVTAEAAVVEREAETTAELTGLMAAESVETAEAADEATAIAEVEADAAAPETAGELEGATTGVSPPPSSCSTAGVPGSPRTIPRLCVCQ